MFIFKKFFDIQDDGDDDDDDDDDVRSDGGGSGEEEEESESSDKVISTDEDSQEEEDFDAKTDEGKTSCAFTTSSSSSSSTRPTTTDFSGVRRSSSVLSAWNDFRVALDEADNDSIKEFTNAIRSNEYRFAYPREREERCVSFAKGTPLSEAVEGLVKFHSKYISPDISENRRKNLARMARVACERGIESPLRLRLAASSEMARSYVSRCGEVFNAIEDHCDDGSVGWDSSDGNPVVSDWNGYGDWEEYAPTQFEKRVWLWHSAAEWLSKSPRPTAPGANDFPLYRLEGPGKWKRTYVLDGRRKSSSSGGRTSERGKRAKVIEDDVSPADEFDDSLRKTEAWKNVISEIKPRSALSTEPNSIYWLVLRCDDDGFPERHRYQSYVGKAEKSVKSRWFGKGGTSHLSSVRSIIGAIYDSGGASEPRGMLVDVALAQTWCRHGSFSGRAFLFVVNSNVVEVAKEESRLIKKYDLTKPRIGLNMKR